MKDMRVAAADCYIFSSLFYTKLAEQPPTAGRSDSEPSHLHGLREVRKWAKVGSPRISASDCSPKLKRHCVSCCPENCCKSPPPRLQYVCVRPQDEDVFSKEYVFMPVHIGRHWSLLLVAHPGVQWGAETCRERCIIHFDSLASLGGYMQHLGRAAATNAPVLQMIQPAKCCAYGAGARWGSDIRT